jgi:hypothetical protein
LSKAGLTMHTHAKLNGCWRKNLQIGQGSIWQSDAVIC